jgi:hypothetical protein
MGGYHRGGNHFVFLQDMFRAVAPCPILMKSGTLTCSILYGGILGVGLSYLLAHYFSSSLFIHYHDWSGWRSITGDSPNRITHSLEKISWALIFCSAWWMIWRLDIFISNTAQKSSQAEAEKNNEPAPSTDFNGENFDGPLKSENFIPEDDDEETIENEEEVEANTGEAKKVIFPTIEELEMAKVLGLPKEDLEDFSKIKTTYRTTIAQYHPDKVSALGTEIRDVAEKKAKEINQAYEFFRKKFKNQ